MKIERIDDKTVKCFLSNEELEEHEIDYRDFVMRSEKAKELVQEIMEMAVEEVGYKPPQFAFDLQIMMIPDEGLVLTFSEKDPLEHLDNKDGEHLVECLKEMKKILQKNKEKLQEQTASKNPAEKTDSIGANNSANNGAGNAANNTANNTGKEPANKLMEKAVRPDFAVFAFRNIGRVIEYARVLPANLRVKSSLYVMDGVYYLYLQKGAAAYERYSRACIQAIEFGSLYAAERDKVIYLEEHGECLVAEKALKKLRLS